METPISEKIIINQMRNVPEIWNKYMRDYHKKRMETDEEYKRIRKEQIYLATKACKKRARDKRIAEGWIPRTQKPQPPTNEPIIV